MFKMVTRILGVIALTGWMGAANATLIFDFSWDSYNGEIIGEIYGLSDNGVDQAATGIVLTSIDAMQVNIDVINDPFWVVRFNDFDVAGGKITFADFWSQFDDGVNDEYKRNFSIYTEEPNFDNYIVGNIAYIANGEVAFDNRVTVPEPSSVILMLLGLAGLSFARYRKQY
ncbi:PEP-CTERM sorting domain-containing protein [Paraglaciecola sp. MB-3u-78]|uniref:PEP-CTERM sorting domain-containing protein n=1 Tax=Paraglaciecola sp. MB-3u-78 TaxID=2058332 RepID=UPI000C34C4C0|nr:PEP-CTERM sorting domain-containing protein [Paraglaciecola sp. MB-3u-78]PKG94520.1 hypothetical protein CXF95_26190 [Paraglaciecola sp. MB-3u-78]